jgi:hypothetical protein
MSSVSIEVLRVQIARMGYNSFTEFLDWLKGYDLLSYESVLSKPDFVVELKFLVPASTPGDERQVERFSATSWQLLRAAWEESQQLPRFTPNENRSITMCILKEFGNIFYDMQKEMKVKLDKLTQWK